MGEAELLCDRSDPITADAAAKCQCRYALCVYVWVCKGGGEPIFLRGTFYYAPARLAQNSLGNWAERLPASLVCVQTPEMVNRIFFLPIAELSRIIIIIIT